MSNYHELYQYRKLTDSDAIRLIVLQPSLDLEDQARCNVLHTSLTECEEDVIDHYTAISYVWGDPEDTRTILVDGGKILSITATLDSALRHIRSWNRPIRLWADAICINQTDIQERNHQVRQMGAIYACALHTIIYFGPSIPEAELFLELLRSSNANTRKPHSVHVLPSLSVSSLSSSFRELGIKYLLVQPWLTRIWVLQELVFSRSPWIQCGRARSRWEDFCRVVRHMKPPAKPPSQPPLPARKSLIGLSSDRQYPSSIESQTQDQKHLKGWELLLAMARFRETFYEQSISSSYGHQGLLDLLRSRRGLGVSDPRDMLFAHTIIARSSEVMEKHRALLQVNYNKKCTEIYERLTVYFIRQLDDFSILSAVADIDEDFRRPEIASWAPDWTISMPDPPWVEIGPTLTVEGTAPGTSYQSMEPDIFGKVTHLFPQWSQPSDRTCMWLPSTLACLGVEIAVVSSTSPIIKWPLPYFDIKNFFWEKIGHDPYKLGIDRTMYEELWNNLDVEIGPGVFPSFGITISGTSQPSIPTSRLTERHKNCLSSINRVLRYMREPVFKLGTSQYLLAQLVKDTFTKDKSIFHGRRITALPDDRLALVPASTRPGDLICCLSGSMIPYVVREHQGEKQTPDEAIRQAFLKAESRWDSNPAFNCQACHMRRTHCDRKKPCAQCERNETPCEYESMLHSITNESPLEKHHDFTALDIDHCKFIGECFVENLMFGWSVPALVELDKRIFAIH